MTDVGVRAFARGVPLAEAAALAGVSKRTLTRRVAEEAVVMVCDRKRRPGALTLEDREEIRVGIDRGESDAVIASRLGRHRGTIGREIAAGGGRARYRAYRAQERADQAARRPKPGWTQSRPRLWAEVQALLRAQTWSPRAIAKRLRRDHPEEPQWWVSHEAIYQAVYIQAKGELRKELAACLRSGRARRKPRGRASASGSKIVAMVNISERPPEVEDRAIPGHWEGDLLMGKANRSAIGTLVERSTRFLILLHLPNGHGPTQVEEAMIEATYRLPRVLWKSLTWDRGSEMAHHAQIKLATDLDIYFCDPASPWQRGSNENTNGLLRQYFPKGTDLSGYHPDYLEFVSAQMNRRPRQTLGWRSPAKALNELLSRSSPTGGVATTA